MIRKISRCLLVALVLTGAGVAALSVAFRSSPARATAPSRVIEFAEAPISPDLREVAVKVAQSAAIDPTKLLDVAGAGSGSNLAGIFVGSTADGSDMISFHNARGMIGFKPLAPVVASRGGMIVYDQASGTSTETKYVALEGAVEPGVEKVTLELTNGSSLDVQLVQAGYGGFSFFTYVSSDPATFPVAVRAYDAEGHQVQSRDVREDLQPACPAGNPGCLPAMGNN